jgi:hypothetical protein
MSYKMKTSISLVTALLLSITSAGCTSLLSDDRQAKLDGIVLYGLVNQDPYDELTASRARSDLARMSCERYADDYCRAQDQHEFVTALISNTYWGGLRNIGTFVPRSLRIRRFDVIVVRFRRGGAGEFLRIASRGETESCGWKGGGPTRALTAAGIVCEDYTWEEFRSALYD